MKICPPKSPLGPAAFADYYAFGADCAAPLVVFIGPATPPDDYDVARRFEPEAVRDAFLAGLLGGGPARLLVMPTPPEFAGAAPFALPLSCRHLREELLPQVASADTPLACVGAGLGAFFASGFAARAPQVAALATLGGPRLAKALGDPLPERLPAISCFANLDDPLRRYADDLYTLLWARGHRVALRERPGGARFNDYVENGSLADAFRFCIERLNRPLRDFTLDLSA